jgi:hypothetical protein
VPPGATPIALRESVRTDGGEPPPSSETTGIVSPQEQPPLSDGMAFVRPPPPDILTWQTDDGAADITRATTENSRRKIAAISSGTTEPILPLASPNEVTLDTNVTRATIPIIPTLYPTDPSGAITVHNHITVNIHNADFREFSTKMDDLLGHLQRSNEISGELRDKLVSELTAGMAILKSPKPDPKIIDLYLKRPLMFIGEKAAGTVVGKVAAALLALLGKVTGLW